ncbi:heavy-metal-associated domain-containing protein [Bacillus sp. T33-2]|uniref:heavy-metal-associated domain-containing protein n=1 Tax=Bacillus sp. T33-2 TaxID=2054168 RepID=UPI000C758A30|nr:heavy-metal-associated domain-containing protein [Bacillus sp. T33-2]PLR95212.1 copper chaperone [Bacillus sp. T33-2]
MENGVVNVKDMANQHDADKVLHALLDVWGVLRAEINLSKGEALFTYDKRMASIVDIEQAIIDTGYDIYHEPDSNVKHLT